MYGDPNNSGDDGTPPFWEGSVTDALETRHSPRVLSHQISSLQVKPFRRKQVSQKYWGVMLGSHRFETRSRLPLETRYCPTFIMILNFVALSQTVWTQVGSLKIGEAGAPPLGRGRAWHRNMLLSHMCYHNKFRRFTSNRFGVSIGVPKIWGNAGVPPLRTGACLPPRNTLLLHICYHIKFRSSRSNRFGVIMEICQNILAPRVPPFKATQGHWNWHGSIGCQWLPISVP